MVNGVAVVEGSMSDDGSRDVNGVDMVSSASVAWHALLHSCTLQPGLSPCEFLSDASFVWVNEDSLRLAMRMGK